MVHLLEIKRADSLRNFYTPYCQSASQPASQPATWSRVDEETIYSTPFQAILLENLSVWLFYLSIPHYFSCRCSCRKHDRVFESLNPRTGSRVEKDATKDQIDRTSYFSFPFFLSCLLLLFFFNHDYLLATVTRIILPLARLIFHRERDSNLFYSSKREGGKWKENYD